MPTGSRGWPMAPELDQSIRSCTLWSMTLRIGDLELQVVSGGQLWIDGGNMFGVIPKALWQRYARPDDLNRILLETNCLIVRKGKQTALIDTGYGAKCSKRQRENHVLQEGFPLVENLSKIGIQPEDLDLVVLTHLHFDHAGGCTRQNGSTVIQPTFPRARYVIQRTEWEDATADLPELAGAYFKDDFVPLEEAGQLELIDGDLELMPGLYTRLMGGHTRGHQVIDLRSQDQQAIYLADLCPLTTHLSTFWTTAYEQYPLALRRTKPKILYEATNQEAVAIFAHDPCIRGAFLKSDDKRDFAIKKLIHL